MLLLELECVLLLRMQQEADQWLPYDEDENDTADSDESIQRAALGQNNFIQSTCIINGEFDQLNCMEQI